MSLTLNLANFSPANLLEAARVSRDTVSGTAVLPVNNTQGFNNNDYVLVGKQGGGQTRIYQILSIANESLTLTENLEFPVERGTNVRQLFGNKLRLYRAAYSLGTTPADSDYNLISGGEVAIDPDQLTTQVTDMTGSADFWYKYTFYNSVSLAETDISGSTAVRDTTSTDYASIDEVRSEAGFAGNANVTDGLIYRKLQAAQSKINGMLSGRYQLPLTKPTSPIIADLTVRLAAGYTMIAEYGTYDGADKTKGEKLRDDAINELKAYQDGSQVITDLTAVSVELPDAGGFESSYSSDNPQGFSRDQIVGYNTREY